MPLSSGAISQEAALHRRKAGAAVLRAGAHTLRPTGVQRLVDAEFFYKTIGDYVGHRFASSTEIYTNVATEALCEVAIRLDMSVRAVTLETP